MIDDNYFSEYIRLLDELANEKDNDNNDKEDNTKFDLLEIFCEYISSNSEFKYNGTYLRDSMVNFLEKLSNFKKKKTQINKFHQKLSKDYLSLGNWYIIIDNLYIVTSDLQFDLLLNFKKYDYFSNLISSFNLYKYDVENITLRYVKISQIGSEKDIIIENEFVDCYKIKFADSFKEIELFSIVKNTLEQNNDNIKGEDTNEKQ